MKHGSLFSGIGGFDLAAEWMGWENVFHCEINEFGRKVLHHYWPEAISYDDITKTDFTKHYGTIDIISGGFPCQPFSAAGERKGSDDDRFLWPEMLRAIAEIKPRWIVAENVYGLLNIDNGITPSMVCSDLEAIGYQKPIVFDCTSDAFGIPTMERHIWFISEAVGFGCKRGEAHQDKNYRNERKLQGANQRVIDRRYISESRFRDVAERVSGRLDKFDKETVRAGGNAISPRIAFEIFKAIEAFENMPKPLPKDERSVATDDHSSNQS
jgi:DNA-cytosine methyltransferase